MATIAGTLAKYDAGGTDSASVIAKLSEAQKKFGLSDAEVADGLDAFARWHVNEVGRGFNKTSSDDAIANSAIQNALNFKTDAGWKDWGLSNYSGYQVFNDAAHYADSPERIAAHRGDIAAEKTRGDAYAAEYKSAADSIKEWYGNSYFDDTQMQGPDWFDRAVKETGRSPTEVANAVKAWNPNDYPWWGPEQRVASLLQTFGVDPAGKVDPNLLQSQQATSAQIGQDRQATHGGNDADFLKGLTAIGLAAGFAGALGAFGAGAGAAEAGAVGTGLVDAGTGVAAVDAGTAAATGLTTATNTGGAFVGSNGLLSGTGNAIADAALNGAVKGAATSALTGGDPIKGALSGGIGGGFASVLPDFGSTALNNAAQGAVSGGVGAAVNGGDILTGAAAGGAAAGVGTLVRDAVPTDIGGNTLTNALAGGAAGAVGTAIAGGDVGTGLIRGAVSGGVSGALTDAGVDPLVAGAGGTLAGGLINGSASPQPSPSTPPAQAVANQVTGALGFSAVLPQFQNLPRRDMQWGTRLNGG